MKESNDRQTRSMYLRNAVILLTLLLVCLILINLVFSNLTSARWDLTADGQFTLSPATIRLIDSLDGNIKIKVFLSDNLPAPDNTLPQRIHDLLSEFHAESHGKLSFEIIHPQSQADEEIAKGFGLRKVAVSQRDESQRSLKLVFKGLTIIYRDTAETIPELRAEDNIEYLIAKSILNLTSPQKKSVGLLTGFGGLAESPILLDSMQTVFGEVFGKRVEVKQIAVKDNCQLDNEPDNLIVFNIQKELSDCAIYAIEQASFRHTSISILQSPTQGDYRQPDQPRFNIDAKINTLLTHTGIQLNADLLLDRNHNLTGHQYTGDDVVKVSQPALPLITNIDKTSPMTQNLSALVLPFSGTLHIDKSYIEQNQGSLITLAKSSDEAVTRPSGGDIGVESLQKTRQDEIIGPHDLIAALQINQKSQFIGRFPETADTAKYTDSAQNVRYFIVPNGEFLFTNQIIGYTDEFAKLGIHLFVNATEWLIQDEALIEIRNRNLPKFIQKPDISVQNRMIWINVIGVPCLVILLMIGLRVKRRLHAKWIKKRYQSSKTS